MRKVLISIIASSLAACLATTTVPAANKSIDDMSLDELKTAEDQMDVILRENNGDVLTEPLDLEGGI